MPITVTLLIKR